MIPPTENGFWAYIKSRHGSDNKNLAMKKLYSRYAWMIDQIPAPDIDAEELSLLQECAHSTWLGDDEDPIELLQRILMIVEMTICNNHYSSEALKAEEGEPYDNGDPPEAQQYRDLCEKIEGWSPLQGLKVIEAIECLDAEHAHIVDLTAEAMILLLRTQRDKEKMRRLRTRIPPYLLTRPEPSQVRPETDEEE